MFKENYQEGVDRGVREGLIHLGKGTTRPFDHQRDLTANCRFFPPLAQKVLKVLSSGVPLKIMELGAGAGVGLSAMSHLAPDATLHAAGSFSPIHPRLRFTSEWCLQNGDKPQSVLNQLLGTPPLREINIHELMAVQDKEGTDIFEELERPFVHQQWIDFLNKCRGVPMSHYDFVYETRGPNWYDPDPAVWQRTKSIVKPEGVLLITSPYGLAHDQTLRISHLILPQSIGTLMVPRSSFLGERIRDEKSRWRFEEPSMEDDLEGLLNEMIQEKTAA